MSLGSFVAPERATGDKFIANENVGKPLLVRVNQFKDALTTKHNPNGDGKGVIVDVVDLTSGDIFIGALWMSGALVDGLSPHAGSPTVLPVVITRVTGKSGNPYLTLAPLADKSLELAQAWYSKNPTTLEDTRKERMAAAAPLGTLTPVEPQPDAPASVVPAAPNQVDDDAIAAALARLSS